MKKSYLIIAVVVLVILAGTLLFLRGNEDTWLCQNDQWVRHGNPSAPQPTQGCGPVNQNTNTGIANPASVNCEQKGGKSQIVTTDAGQLGLCEFTDGSKCEEWAYFRNECAVGNKIVVYSPAKNAEVTFPLTVAGEARGDWYFEASFPIKIVDSQNKVIAQIPAKTQGDWMTQNFVPFTATLSGAVTQRTEATLILQRDNPSGLPQNDESISIPIILLPSETTKINVYFGNSQLDPDIIDCSKVLGVQRIIPKTQAIGQSALEELLKGPIEAEKQQGYFTSINPDVKIQSLTVENGTAKVDFNQTLQQAVGGSCRVAQIRSQITQTLKQFPTVKDVIISINGDTETILQP